MTYCPIYQVRISAHARDPGRAPDAPTPRSAAPPRGLACRGCPCTPGARFSTPPPRLAGGERWYPLPAGDAKRAPPFGDALWTCHTQPLAQSNAISHGLTACGYTQAVYQQDHCTTPLADCQGGKSQYLSSEGEGARGQTGGYSGIRAITWSRALRAHAPYKIRDFAPPGAGVR